MAAPLDVPLVMITLLAQVIVSFLSRSLERFGFPQLQGSLYTRVPFPEALAHIPSVVHSRYHVVIFAANRWHRHHRCRALDDHQTTRHQLTSL